MALSFHVTFCYHDALLFRVPTWGLVFLKGPFVGGKKKVRHIHSLHAVVHAPRSSGFSCKVKHGMKKAAKKMNGW